MDTLNQNINLKLSIWLFALCLMIVAMIFIGGVTRLTGSGLSMVEWRPFLGFLPPLTETEWTRVFELYKLSPEFKQINSWMEISDFKFAISSASFFSSFFWLDFKFMNSIAKATPNIKTRIINKITSMIRK